MARRPARPHAFGRGRSLKRRRLIRPLFERDRPDVGRLSHGVVTLLWRVVPREALGRDVPFQAGFFPGRRARTNAGRTRLRRLLRETFRRHQGALAERFEAGPDALTLVVLFRGAECTASADLRRDLPAALARLSRRLARDPDTDSPPGPPEPDAPPTAPPS